MTTPHETLACPWCAHDAATGDDFRTHLMVEHRKSDLAAYVLEVQNGRADAAGEADAEREDGAQDSDGEDEESSGDDEAAEPELVAN